MAILGVLLVTAGLISILLMFPSFVVLEIAYQVGLIAEYMGIAPEQYGWSLHTTMILNLLFPLAAATDGLAAMYKTGRMLSPFGQSTLLGWLILAFVLMGQGRVFDQLVLIWTGINLFNSTLGLILSMSVVLAIHWCFSKLRPRSPESEEKDEGATSEYQSGH